MKIILNHNKNETDEHFALKLSAWRWLEDKCQIIGTEVSGDDGGRIDVAGLDLNLERKRVTCQPDNNFPSSTNVFTGIRGGTLRHVEAKASRGDFAKQFGNFTESQPEYNWATGEETSIALYRYVITIKDMFERSEIPKGYGWLEVNLESGLYSKCRKNPRKTYVPTPHGRDHHIISWFNRISWSASSRMARNFSLVNPDKD